MLVLNCINLSPIRRCSKRFCLHVSFLQETLENRENQGQKDIFEEDDGSTNGDPINNNEDEEESGTKDENISSP